MLAGPSLLAHEVYVSMCRIRYDPETNVLTARVRIFSDNLDDAVFAATGTRPGLLEETAHPDADSLIAAYLRPRLQFVVNGDSAAWTLTGARPDLDATECTLVMAGVALPETLAIHNALLVEQFEQQTNIVRVRLGDHTSFLNFNRIITDETVRL